MVERRIGFVGLGAMGMPVARRLAAAGHALVVHDLDPERVARARAFAEVAADVAAVVARADVLMTCLPSPEAVAAVYGEVVKPGLLACDLSTIGPQQARTLHDELAARGVRHVECPMIGGAPEAAAGTLYLVVSGEADDIARVVPLLGPIGRTHRVVGESGTASLYKSVQNGLGLVQMAAIAEALAMVAKAGGDLGTFVEVVGEAGGMAATPLFRAKAPMMCQASPPVVGHLDIGAKDSRVSAALAAELGLDLPLFARSAALFAKAKAAGLGLDDIATVARVVEEETGVRIRRDDA